MKLRMARYILIFSKVFIKVNGFKSKISEIQNRNAVAHPKIFREAES